MCTKISPNLIFVYPVPVLPSMGIAINVTLCVDLIKEFQFFYLARCVSYVNIYTYIGPNELQ